MKFEPNTFYHVYNQGNNKQCIFQTKDEYRFFLCYVRKYIKPHCEIVNYCLMPNHFHFIISVDERCLNIVDIGNISISVISNGFRLLLSKYAQWHNNLYGKSGSLFRPRTKSKVLALSDFTYSINDDDLSYLNTCFQYIHENPVKANLVMKPEEWKWSSANLYLNGINDNICNKTFVKKVSDLLGPTRVGPVY